MKKEFLYDVNKLKDNEKILYGDKEIVLSLTEKDSHKFFIPGGQGGFSIGIKGLSEGEFDVLLDKDEIINWNCFDGYYSMAGYQEKNKYPYGNWPRFFYYQGNDIGFIKWSFKRRIESFYWEPQKDMMVDFTNAMIGSLTLKTNYKIELLLGNKIRCLNLLGNLENYSIKKCDSVTSLFFQPDYDKNLLSYKLPNYEVLKNIERIEVRVSPLSPPFDCTSLLQFPNIKELSLLGNMTNLNVLKNLKNIEKLGMWDMPNLSFMPKLESWKNLKWFVAVNIDENGGRLFRQELVSLKKSKKFDFVSVRKLRNPLWFETNYGIPFSYWEGINEKKAINAYKKCLKNVKNSNNEEEIKIAIVDFIKKINKLENIESTERDDVYTALCTIMKNSPINIDNETWKLWFDEVRNF